MTSLSLFSVLVLYPLSLFGDGCILIAIALAATVGGRPLLWGVSFAFFHALYGVLGLLFASEVATYSEHLGDVFILLGSFILLRHFMHHTLHHQVGGDCSCENHKQIPVSARAIVSTASAFSIHSFASGAIVRGISGDLTTPLLVAVIMGLSVLVGAVIAAIVFIGDLERLPILKALDSLPGVVATLLTGMCCFAVYHLVSDLYEFSPLTAGAFVIISTAVAISMGIKVHNHRSKGAATPLTQISSRRPATDGVAPQSQAAGDQATSTK
jgi:hypothetical protein